MNDTDFNGIKQNSHQMRIYCVRLSLSVCLCSGWSVFAFTVSNEIYTHTHSNTMQFTLLFEINNSQQKEFGICFNMKIYVLKWMKEQ